MADTLSIVERSKLMSSVRTKDTNPEMLVRRYLHGQGFRYRLQDKQLPGKPDIVLTKHKTVIFIHGCFWHKHGPSCSKKARVPQSNTEFWEVKLASNVQRDRFVQDALQAAGWKVLVVWECELKRAHRGATLTRLTADILGNDEFWEAA
ncbi:very short patch repair endonuclease [Hymenobacter metallilatus]|uniref:Very short patch repair endonuclease n=1 Tax=Hymenobacter metallilatus TaxID=2493666 RepID=A0A3R9U6P2_9BACT|nr:DNA mismatch endonuclease Vsr [Hymenobacter metallilatus]RSK23942.1 DNA mismatch endonuclease Vsr [Hymenobacter metallilatus]